MLELQVQLLDLWWRAGDALRERLRAARDDERGELNSQVIIIVLLSAAALTAGAIIAAKIIRGAEGVPEP